MNNKYVNRSKISEAKFRELVRLFALDLTATQIAGLSGLNRNTVNRYIKAIRRRIAEYCRVVAPVSFSSEVMPDIQECKEITILGICEKEGVVYTSFYSDEKQLQKAEVRDCLDMIVYLDNGQQYWMTDRATIQEEDSLKVNCIDGFRGFLKSRLEKFKGIHSHTCYLHMKESEFRYNNPKNELYHLILKIIRSHPLF
ncbi:transposase [Fodinibius sediminis]|uniref:Transposase n=1 Tax=Fodinibius sediminis TaxID=1214077 RepID=A0A521C6E2_9BACT|nr:hypothetical protein [Fodinibius sediminis]SMO54935.1 transposase [Fodinibius sediminis]